MAARLPSTPPVLPGFTHVHILGKGGFADVFLYEQNLPRRPVAVKVMHADLVDDRVRAMFRAEVDLMGRLSAHPAILSVYSASVSSDGRPYLVMELCSTEIGDRFREHPYELDEALEIAIRIGGALETAHRAGTLHRDVKPANILTTAFGHPVLSDFGIAVNPELADPGAAGISVPWSAPEVLRDETSGTVASEVWSFGATLYSLVVGRSPAEIRGGRNGTEELSARILAHDLQPFDVDAPRTLVRIVRRSLAREPGGRFPSVLAMVEELQSVQEEMGVPVTPVDLAERPWARGAVVSGQRGEDELPIRARATRRRAPLRGVQQIDISASTQSSPPPARRGIWGLAVGIGTAVVLGLIAVAAVAVTTTQGAIPVVEEVVGNPVDGGVEFRWEDPGLVNADSYLIEAGPDQPAVIQRGTTFTVQGDSGTTVCVTVSVNRDGQSSDGTEGCAEVP